MKNSRVLKDGKTENGYKIKVIILFNDKHLQTTIQMLKFVIDRVEKIVEKSLPLFLPFFFFYIKVFFLTCHQNVDCVATWLKDILYCEQSRKCLLPAFFPFLAIF